MEAEFLSLPRIRLRLVLNKGKELFYVTNIIVEDIQVFPYLNIFESS